METQEEEVLKEEVLNFLLELPDNAHSSSEVVHYDTDEFFNTGPDKSYSTYWEHIGWSSGEYKQIRQEEANTVSSSDIENHGLNREEQNYEVVVEILNKHEESRKQGKPAQVKNKKLRRKVVK